MKLEHIDSVDQEDDPLWYKDAVIYEVHVRAFADSNADGIGDFPGLVEKLDYLQDLGVTALWLLPFYPSPLRDDGYDIADYTDVNPIYGTLNDFRTFLREAHARGLRVITELVVNHTSDQHPWFQRARRSPPGSPWRDFYVWSDTPEKFKDARIIFSDFEKSNWTWDNVAHAYYWHRFYSHQPDLNFDNPAVQEAIMRVMDFWLGMGIDGLRLDAVPYLFEREGTNCENLPETHEFLKRLRKHVDDRFRNRMFLAEANQWPEDAVAYFGQGDECQMAFHFPVMPRMFMAVQMEDRFPIIDILQQTPSIPDSTQWALFLRNHDELTLEMVTDEDRDYMYRVYAQEMTARLNLGIRRRLAPLLENHRGKIELMYGLLFSLPGTPVIYYGDEIGMGDNMYLGDRNGVRTPMQWNPERNAGFSRANPQRLFFPVIIDPEYQYQTVNVEAQQNNPHSLLWWLKRLIDLRKHSHAFGRGSLDFLFPDNRKVLAFVRQHEGERILVVANLSRSVQYAALDLAEFKGLVPVEMLGQTALPQIGEAPYVLTLGPYAFYWLSLRPAEARLRVGQIVPAHEQQPALEGELPVLFTGRRWQDIVVGRAREDLEPVLLQYMQRQSWFVGGERELRSTEILDCLPNSDANPPAMFLLVKVRYAEGEDRRFVIPVSYRPISGRPKEDAETTGLIHPVSGSSLICRLRIIGADDRKYLSEGWLFDPAGERETAVGLLASMSRHRRCRGEHGELVTWTTPVFPGLRVFARPRPEAALMASEHLSSVITYGDRVILKVYRSVEEGIHPEAEIGRALMEKTSFRNVEPLAGGIEYRTGRGRAINVAVLLGHVANQGDAWSYTIDVLKRFFMDVLAHLAGMEPFRPSRPFLHLINEPIPPVVLEQIGSFLESVRLMGQRTAELHLALASLTDNPDFAPEPFNVLYQRSLYQTGRTRVAQVLDLLRERQGELPEEARLPAQALLNLRDDLLSQLREVLQGKVAAQRIRCHGDFRLGSLLSTGKDFIIIDFEGEALRPLSNRRHKVTPIKDVANMLHSIHAAVQTALHLPEHRREDLPVLEPWARFWNFWVSVDFVKSYLETAATGNFLPKSREELRILFDFYLLSRGLTALRWQLISNLAGAQVPLQALLRLLELRGRTFQQPQTG
jgi:maltose alpha-D-glucosyltransferase/alpha-amylase